MLIDVVLVTVLLALVADALIGERFARVFGGSARRLRGHVVIAGLGTVGFRVLDELHRRGYRCAGHRRWACAARAWSSTTRPRRART